MGAGIAIAGALIAGAILAGVLILADRGEPAGDGRACAQWEREAQAAAQVSAASFPEQFNFRSVPQHDPDYILALYRASGFYQRYRFDYQEPDDMSEVGERVDRPATCRP